MPEVKVPSLMQIPRAQSKVERDGEMIWRGKGRLSSTKFPLVQRRGLVRVHFVKMGWFKSMTKF